MCVWKKSGVDPLLSIPLLSTMSIFSLYTVKHKKYGNLLTLQQMEVTLSLYWIGIIIEYYGQILL